MVTRKTLTINENTRAASQNGGGDRHLVQETATIPCSVPKKTSQYILKNHYGRNLWNMEVEAKYGISKIQSLNHC